MKSSHLWLTVLVLACGGRDPEPAPAEPASTGDEAPPEPAPPPPPPPQAMIRLIHAAVEAREQPITLVADGGPSTPAAAYEFASTYLAIDPGEHELSARAGDAELIGTSLSFPEGHATVIAYSTGDFPAALAHVPDTSDPAPTDQAQIRVFHGMVGQGALDVCAPPASGRGDGTPIVADVAAGAFGGGGAYVSVAAGAELVLQLRAHHATPCHGRAVGLAHGFTPVAGSNYTLVLVGRPGRRGAVPLELLFCADPPATDTSCATVPITAH